MFVIHCSVIQNDPFIDNAFMAYQRGGVTETELQVNAKKGMLTLYSANY